MAFHDLNIDEMFSEAQRARGYSLRIDASFNGGDRAPEKSALHGFGTVNGPGGRVAMHDSDYQSAGAKWIRGIGRTFITAQRGIATGKRPAHVPVGIVRFARCRACGIDLWIPTLWTAWACPCGTLESATALDAVDPQVTHDAKPTTRV